MKIRNGFVSNSSASSFIVRCKDWQNNKIILSDENIKKLFKYGFNHDKDLYELEYDVPCNETDVLEFLLSNKISFSSKLHYGHWTMCYNAETDNVLIGCNFGEIFDTYHKNAELSEKTIKYFNELKSFYQIKGTKLLESGIHYTNPN